MNAGAWIALALLALMVGVPIWMQFIAPRLSVTGEEVEALASRMIERHGPDAERIAQMNHSAPMIEAKRSRRGAGSWSGNCSTPCARQAGNGEVGCAPFSMSRLQAHLVEIPARKQRFGLLSRMPCARLRRCLHRPLGVVGSGRGDVDLSRIAEPVEER